MLIGEAPGQNEQISGVPFVGAGGRLLTELLRAAGIRREACYLTNVFFCRPFANDIKNLCGSKADAGGKTYTLPPLRMGQYILPEYLPHLARLESEIAEVKPNLVVLLGNTACWAVLKNSGINRIRGNIEMRGDQKCLATYHPSMVLRDWSQRAVVIADFMKAKRHSTSRAFTRPTRTTYVIETLADLLSMRAACAGTKLLAFDIETKNRQITCIGFAPNSVVSYVVPLVSREGARYFSREDEPKVWAAIRDLLALPCPKVAQNGLYDMQYLWKVAGIPVKNYLHDTMLLHHALQPEMQKSLQFLASVYADEVSWKSLSKNADTLKKDE